MGSTRTLRTSKAPEPLVVACLGLSCRWSTPRSSGEKCVPGQFPLPAHQRPDRCVPGLYRGPAKVVRVALQNAASVAGLLITTEAMITDRPKKDTSPQMPSGGGGMGGMDGMDF